ncbi:hypothetical protein LPB03_10725 [Polaribacter vadi]|uniref:Transporter n=1 Tax=Polaribacter vadi TaxID=1774273 RepID=A0A1B8TSE6_9FLAO|nr:hypothetical protein [Polaribacter vadi]AOW17900.1 hypothetical protein LPB03_10725 [Polaribacter vadi]OBY62626.1 hypothetical protein LPB3_10735 [Polaribacter vadi]
MKSITLLFSLFITSTLFAQSPWTKEKGDLFLNISYTTISDYNEIFGDPDYFANGKITDNTYQIYSEYGLSDKTTFIASIPLKSISVDNFVYIDPAINCAGDCSELLNFNKTAFGNISLGIKHQFYNKGWVISGQFVTQFNTSTLDAKSGIRTGYNAYTFTPQLLVGKSFGKTFFQSHIGVDVRTNDYSNNFKIGGEFGGKVLKNIWLIGFVDVVESFDDGNRINDNPLNGLYQNDQEYGAYGLKAILQLCDLGVTASFANAFSGNNVPKQSAFSIGIFNTF